MSAKERRSAIVTGGAFGLAGFAGSMNAELRGAGIATCTLFPGVVDTPMG